MAAHNKMILPHHIIPDNFLGMATAGWLPSQPPGIYPPPFFSMFPSMACPPPLCTPISVQVAHGVSAAIPLTGSEAQQQSQTVLVSGVTHSQHPQQSSILCTHETLPQHHPSTQRNEASVLGQTDTQTQSGAANFSTSTFPPILPNTGTLHWPWTGPLMAALCGKHKLCLTRKFDEIIDVVPSELPSDPSQWPELWEKLAPYTPKIPPNVLPTHPHGVSAVQGLSPSSHFLQGMTLLLSVLCFCHSV